MPTPIGGAIAVRFIQAGESFDLMGVGNFVGTSNLPRQGAGSYFTKPAGHADPGDAYESVKFGSHSSSLIFAQAVWRFAAAKRRAQLMR